MKKRIANCLLDHAPVFSRLNIHRILQDPSQRVMSDLGFNMETYAEFLDDFELTFEIGQPNLEGENLNQSGLLINSPDRKERALIEVPDLSIDELIEIAVKGVWPNKYFLIQR